MGLTYNVMPFPKFFAVDVNGAPYAGGKLYAYASGLVTPQDTYSDSIGTPNTNPVTLDASGRAAIYLAPKAYSFELKDANGVSVWTADPVYGYSLTTDYGLCGGRLTLTSGTPVTTSDVTAAGTVYFTPYTGSVLALFDGVSAWGAFPFTEISVAVPAVASQMYDIFASQTAGVVSLSLVAWTNDTTRATAITLQNGVYVKSGATSFRYLGSFRTTGVVSQTEDSNAKRYLWNYMNRVRRSVRAFDSTATWTYQTATVRQANGAATNQVDLVIGVAEDAIDILLSVGVQQTGVVIVSAGIGEDSTTTYAAGAAMALNATAMLSARLTKVPAVGRHFYSWNEWSTAAGTTTWSGITAGAGSTITNGLSGQVRA